MNVIISWIALWVAVYTGVYFGDAQALFSDWAFPSILLLTMLPPFVLVFLSVSVKGFSLLDIFRNKHQLSHDSLQKLNHLADKLGNYTLVNGIFVFVVNVMSIAYNWKVDVHPQHLTAAFAVAIMSVLLGGVVKLMMMAVQYDVGFYLPSPTSEHNNKIKK